MFEKFITAWLWFTFILANTIVFWFIRAWSFKKTDSFEELDGGVSVNNKAWQSRQEEKAKNVIDVIVAFQNVSP